MKGLTYEEYIAEIETEKYNTFSETLKMFIILQKYMKHVTDEEGISFVESLNRGCGEVVFTSEEVKTLIIIDKQVNGQ